MTNRSHLKRFLTAGLGLAGAILIGGHFAETNGQAPSGRDPFAKPAWARQRDPRTAKSALPKPSASAVQAMMPTIDQRIEFFKRLRETAAMNNQPLPKVTSVLTLDEMAVTGIFKTPRGYAAMVEAVPIKLSYTIYPGEKFFDGQLVAVEENKLVFRKVTKLAKNKFVASVENKMLRKYTQQEEIQGTAPAESTGRPPEAVATYQPPAAAETAAGKQAAAGAPAPVISPLDEMNNQQPEADTVKKSAKSGKKPLKVAKNR